MRLDARNTMVLSIFSLFLRLNVIRGTVNSTKKASFFVRRAPKDSKRDLR